MGQYTTLMRTIYLIDCPGVVYPSGDTESEIVLKGVHPNLQRSCCCVLMSVVTGVVRAEKLEYAQDHIPLLLERAKPHYLVRTFGVKSWKDHIDFLSQCTRLTGKLLKGGEPDLNTAAKMILNDFQCGRIPVAGHPLKMNWLKQCC